MYSDQLSPNFADPLKAPPPGPSPFNDEPAPFVPPQWRADRRAHIPAAGGDSFGAPGESVSVYVAALGGTALAGGLFPSAMLVFGVAVALVRRWAIPPLDDEAAIVFVGFLIGSIYAAIVGVVVFSIVGVVQYLAGLFRWRGVMAAAAGGWTGFAAVSTIGIGTRNVGGAPPLFMFYVLSAMLMGQVGAAWAARKVTRRQIASRGWRAPLGGARFTLRQLLGLTAAVAIVAAILSALHLANAVHAAIGIAALFQIATIGGYLVATRFRKRKLNPPPASESASFHVKQPPQVAPSERFT